MNFAISQNPTTGEILARYPMQTASELDQAFAQSAQAFNQWRYSSMETRVTVLRQLGEQLRQRETELSRMITLEMGKPVAQARGEILKCANL